MTVRDIAAADGWEWTNPHIVTLVVEPADIDAYGHVNNAVYLSWLDRAAWSHSAALGVPLERCLTIRRGMAAHRTEIDYLRSALLGQTVWVGTWITATDGRLRVERRFQIRRPDSDDTLGSTLALDVAPNVAMARTSYVCINLDTGRAARMPAELSQAYQVTTGQ